MKNENLSCALCQGFQHELIYTTKDRHYGIKGEFNIYKCKSCELVFIKPLLSESELNELYPQNYYAYQDFKDKSSLLQRINRRFVLKIGTRDPKFEKPGKMLDVGCGSGKFLYSQREKGWETYGVEVSKAAAEFGRKAAGLDIFGGNLVDAAFESNTFDYVRSNHSFEHITNPGEVLDEVYRILKPGGKLMIGVPNINGLAAKMFGKYWWYLGAPVHPFNYSDKTLPRVLAKHQFKVEKVAYNSDFNSLLGSWQIYLNRNNGKLSTDGFFINNYVLKVINHWSAKVLDACGMGDCIEITCSK